MKTSELIGPALDYAVAKCKGETYQPKTEYDGIGLEYAPHCYSTDWTQGGPIIEREKIATGFDDAHWLWVGTIYGDDTKPDISQYGPTPPHSSHALLRGLQVEGRSRNTGRTGMSLLTSLLNQHVNAVVHPPTKPGRYLSETARKANADKKRQETVDYFEEHMKGRGPLNSVKLGFEMEREPDSVNVTLNKILIPLGHVKKVPQPVGTPPSRAFYYEWVER